jgi:hypothetical protein
MLARFLIEAADERDRLAAAKRTCPRSAPHEPNTRASMVPGKDWRCPGA